ncbi:MAG TPA: cyclic nucleotide-binding domain-containing protein [Thermoanaerobaculia bacterium]|nr:cyclic nucleotide-binding domain-containing protein [Thermoanaerobaculia bacterium]
MNDFLRGIALFRDLDDEQIARLTAVAIVERHPAYELIFREGDPVDAFYIVQEGLVTVFRDEQGKPQQVLARLEAGGFFCEMGLLNDKARRYASARTAAPAVLLRVDKPDLIELLRDNPALELKLRAEVIRRHGMNVSALLGLAGQRDVRIRLGVPAVLELEDGARLSVMLENLSLGGVGLSGVPASWQTGLPLRFRLGRPGESTILGVNGSVSWREGDTVGIAFAPEAAGDPVLINRALRRFMEGRR